MFIKKKKSAQATMEYLLLIIFVLTAFFVFRKYILRGFTGRWKTTGDSFAYGMYYDPKTSIDCKYWEFGGFGFWYNATCEREKCAEECFSGNYRPDECQACLLAPGNDCFNWECQT